ncbi:hypothetical protein ACFPYM_14140, partial [Methylobacterium hispanicum]
MPLDFATLLDAETRRRLDLTRSEVERCFGLADRWLAREIASAARRIRASVPEMASPASGGDAYTKHVLWCVVPELARRLGEPLLPNESVDMRLRASEGDELRDHVGICLANVGRVRLMRDVPAELRDVLHLLLHEPANGSPIAMALDRIAPPAPDADDRLARGIREISRRRGHDEVSAWHPGLQ